MGQEVNHVLGDAPFNSAFEVGFRALTVLAEMFPVEADLQRLVFYDYLVLHSGDVPDGPSSLHPATPYRSQEYTVRRDVLRQGLLLMASRGLVHIAVGSDGIKYKATETTIPFLDRLTSTYSKALVSRASWIVSRFGDTSDEALSKFFTDNVGRWGSEFLFMRDFSDELAELASLGR